MNNREIKFRAWENELKEMIPIHSIDFESQMVNRERGWRLFNEIKLLQFTGLKDKNGKEIYEGDIVYVAGTGNVEIKFPFIELYDAAMENDIGSILGNVFENPELLK